MDACKLPFIHTAAYTTELSFNTVIPVVTTGVTDGFWGVLGTSLGLNLKVFNQH